MVDVPHPLYSPDIALCNFVLFPKLKLKLKRHCFDIIQEIKKECQAVLDSLQGRDFTELLKGGRGAGINAYTPKETILKGIVPIFKIKLANLLFLA